VNTADINAAKRDVAEAKRIVQIAETRIARLEREDDQILLAEAESKARNSAIWETARHIKSLCPGRTMRACVDEAMEGALALVKAPHSSERGCSNTGKEC